MSTFFTAHPVSIKRLFLTQYFKDEVSLHVQSSHSWGNNIKATEKRHSNKTVQLHSTHVMWLTPVPAHKPHGGMTLGQLQILPKPRGEHQMLTLSHWCGKCQRCRWRGFLFSGVRLRPVPAVRHARHLIHKHGGGLWMLWSAWQAAGEMPSYCTGLWLFIAAPLFVLKQHRCRTLQKMINKSIPCRKKLPFIWRQLLQFTFFIEWDSLIFLKLFLIRMSAVSLLSLRRHTWDKNIQGRLWAHRHFLSFRRLLFVLAHSHAVAHEYTARQ